MSSPRNQNFFFVKKKDIGFKPLVTVWISNWGPNQTAINGLEFSTRNLNPFVKKSNGLLSVCQFTNRLATVAIPTHKDSPAFDGTNGCFRGIKWAPTVGCVMNYLETTNQRSVFKICQTNHNSAYIKMLFWKIQTLRFSAYSIQKFDTYCTYCSLTLYFFHV